MSGSSFEAILIRPEGVGTWTYLNIPKEVTATFGLKGQVKVKGMISGYQFQSTALPQGDDTHYLVVGKSIRDQIGATQGDTVKVMLELDVEERQVDIPQDLEQAFESQPQAKEAFNQLTYSHQKEYLSWILSAKHAGTRQRRIEKAIMLLSQSKKLRE